MFRLALALVVMFFSSFAFADVPSQKLVSALIQQESGGNDHAIGDNGKAYGCLQIWQSVLDDVNRRCGTKVKQQDLLGNRGLSIWVCEQYINMYATSKRLGRTPTLQDMARIWNGGPNGWKRSSTVGYWLSVNKRMR